MNSKRKKAWIILLVIFFVAGASGSYFLLHKVRSPERAARLQIAPGAIREPEDFFDLRIFYPLDNRLQMVEKRLPRRTKQTAIAEAVVEEYFSGPGNGSASCIPPNVKLLGLYKDQEHILYVDLSDELRRNFQGSALSEYLLLKGLYESLISNLQDVEDVKVLVEGKEIETMGGHVFLKYPLKSVISAEFKGDKIISGG
jgi:hypothetical protein